MIVTTFGENPEKRNDHSCSVIENQLYIFGGETSINKNNDFYRLNLDSNIWKKETVEKKPPPRGGHTIVTWKNDLYLYGGYFNGREYDDLWKFSKDKNEWTLLKEKTNKGRHYHSANIIDNCILIYGGHDGEGPIKELISFDLEKCEWKQIERDNDPQEEPRYSHGSCTYKGLLYIKSGRTGSIFNRRIPRNDFIYFDFSKKKFFDVEQYGDIPKNLYNSYLTQCNGFIYNTMIFGEIYEYSIHTKLWKRLNVGSFEKVGGITFTYNNHVYLHGGFHFKNFTEDNELISFRASIPSFEILNHFFDVEFNFPKKRKREEEDDRPKKKFLID